ncbi:dual specificity protein phosphatase 19-like isoform X2 [Anneissia japonica]|uniref:dual specificity protein phosphatase 19-like isoform X2 n=1 Tax=Anneissia japonica TaxID=1529436 RepID=UPI001425B58D|nr:dual specificity protein phosphatase 19-like isoform X2 [Anneissia japonica]
MNLQEQLASSRQSLKPVNTKVLTVDGHTFTERRNETGSFDVTRSESDKKEKIGGGFFVVDTKPDLQVLNIRPGLYLSSQDVAHRLDLIKEHGITHILNTATGVQNLFPEVLTYKHVEILDLPETDLTRYFEECFSFIEQGRHDGSVLIHCNAGVSRSCTVALAYLVKTEDNTPQENPGYWPGIKIILSTV